MRTRRRSLLRAAGVAALAVAVMACDAPPAQTTALATPRVAAPAAPETTITIGIHQIRAEIADTWPRRERGLSGRPELRTGYGMIFPYGQPARPAFWMPDMHFDIDIVWIRGGRIVDLHTDVPHQVRPPLPRYSPRQPIDWVLEVPAGTVARAAWKIGDPVQAEPTPRFRDSEEG